MSWKVSPLKSPKAIALGLVPTVIVEGVPKVPEPVPNNTITLEVEALVPKLVTARSGLLSPLKSATATEAGFVPTVILVAAW